MYMINVSGLSTVSQIRNYSFSVDEIFYMKLILFLGFGFKIPIWPFHY